MKKMPTLFVKNPENLGRVLPEIDPQNDWVKQGLFTASQKYDGTAAAIINKELYKRYDVKIGKSIPDGAIPCQEIDVKSGHHPHWVKCDRDNPEDRYFFEALDARPGLINFHNGNIQTYELLGPKINGNREGLKDHTLVEHGAIGIELEVLARINYDTGIFVFLKGFLSENDLEGIVFKHKHDDRMCKIRKKDFGLKR